MSRVGAAKHVSRPARVTIFGIASLVFASGAALAGHTEQALKPARNGLIAYSYKGDIYVGDMRTGKSTAVVTNPKYEVNPIFAPDGRRIAFIRGNPQTGEAKVVVVRADGSDERLIFPEGRKHRGLGSYGWTPDSDFLVVQLDRLPFVYLHDDGELSLFDSLGTGKERILTPPLTLSIGGHYWGHNQVAPMFRPPSGASILAGGWNTVRLFDRQLKKPTLLTSALKRYEPYHAGQLTWSPDGTRILFDLGLARSTPTTASPTWTPRPGGGLFVMSAEGKRPRRIRGGDFVQWSPDSSQIAFERVRQKIDRATLVVRDLKSGEEHVLGSTLAAGKNAGAKFPTTTYNNLVHHWFYEGWTWSPDGRKLLILEDHRTRPWVIDVSTDTVTKLPWLADSMPSWQPVRRR
jgi:dipeptidyl aminopeptidase/acylaminoacyl peptidase